MRKPEMMNTAAFAERAGVTVRTLRYYDRMGLVCPQNHTEAGFRLYGVDDLVRLQQVMTLKFIGFSLSEIRRILDSPDYSLFGALQAQRQAVARKAEQMQLISRAIDEALDTMSANEVDWERFAGIIKAVMMEQSKEWLKEYYTQEQLEKLASREWTPEMQAKAEADWKALYADAERLAKSGADPAGKEAQALAARFRAMIEQFTQGDPEIEASLKRMYADSANMPADYRMGDNETNQFTSAMLAAYENRG